jgi:hypothetical protein
MLLIFLVLERAMVDLPHDAVGGVGRTEHEVAEQSQLRVQLLVAPGDVFWLGHAVGHGQSPNSGNSPEPWNATIRPTPSLVSVSTCSACGWCAPSRPRA